MQEAIKVADRLTLQCDKDKAKGTHHPGDANAVEDYIRVAWQLIDDMPCQKNKTHILRSSRF